MEYIYIGGDHDEPMHIHRYTPAGRGTREALCRTELPFNRTINAPFALGKGVCEECLDLAND